MCIAIFNKGNALSESTLRTSWQNNPHGAGLLYVDAQTGQLKADKFEKGEFDKFRNRYYVVKSIKAYKNYVVLHFRVSTHGVQTAYNVHPFLNNSQNLGFVHNGILYDFGGAGAKSDTHNFRDKVVGNLCKDFWFDADTRKYIERLAGYWNKLIFMNNKCQVYIVNEELGHWNGGNWFSNDSYCTNKVYAGNTLVNA